MKKLAFLLAVVLCINMLGSVMVFAGGEWYPLSPKGWRFRIDPPNAGYDQQEYHVHVEYKGKEVGTESVTGKTSHGRTLKDVDNKIKKQIKDHKKYKDAKKKQKELEDAKKKIKAKKLNLWKPVDIIIAIGIIIFCTATWFFPGDDVFAWGNFLRALGI